MDQSVTHPETPQDASTWVDVLNEALTHRMPRLQKSVEQTVREYPREHQILYLAALAALVGEDPERCQRYLKRIGKSYELDGRHHLLHAIALAQQGIVASALQFVRKAGLDDPYQVSIWFFGDQSLRPWLLEWLGRIRARCRICSTPVFRIVRAEEARGLQEFWG